MYSILYNISNDLCNDSENALCLSMHNVDIISKHTHYIHSHTYIKQIAWFCSYTL